jgi:aminoglycoside N3'-acetyltransferase
MAMHSVTDLARQIAALGLVAGDTVLVRASASKIGDVGGSRPRRLIEAFLDVLGPQGTLVGLAFTKTFLFPSRHPEYVFDGTNPATSGGFASAMLAWPSAVRSRHPTNSFVAVGRLANEMMDEHDETKHCFFPVERLVAARGKMYLVGCINESPGFSTVHLAQWKLGLATQSVLGPFAGVLHRKDGRVSVFRKRDMPGCSMGFDNFYGYYVKAGELRCGKVGDADALAIDAHRAYEIELELIRQNPRLPLCHNPDCESCRGSLLYNLRDAPRFYARRLVPMIRRLVRQL